MPLDTEENVQFNLPLSKEDINWLEKESNKQGIGMAEFVRNAIEAAHPNFPNSISEHGENLGKATISSYLNTENSKEGITIPIDSGKSIELKTEKSFELNEEGNLEEKINLVIVYSSI